MFDALQKMQIGVPLQRFEDESIFSVEFMSLWCFFETLVARVTFSHLSLPPSLFFFKEKMTKQHPSKVTRHGTKNKTRLPLIFCQCIKKSFFVFLGFFLSCSSYLVLLILFFYLVLLQQPLSPFAFSGFLGFSSSASSSSPPSSSTQ